MQCLGAEGQALFCWQCVCISWQSLLGAGLPLIVCGIYAFRVAREMTLDDLIILVFATIFTFASRSVSEAGVAHAPWMVYIVVMRALAACSTEQESAHKSLPFVGVMIFVSVFIPDVASAVFERKEGQFAIPGGRGLIDGLVLKPLMGIGVTWLVYTMKVKGWFAGKGRRGYVYDQASREYLLNVSPRFVRPDRGAELRLVRKAVGGSSS